MRTWIVIGIVLLAGCKSTTVQINAEKYWPKEDFKVGASVTVIENGVLNVPKKGS